MKKILICCSKDWINKQEFIKLADKVQFIDKKNDLSKKFLKNFDPDYIFFVHWSWIVKKDVVDNFNCILFHTAPLPFGRGGSPIQNLILLGYEKAPLNALKMTHELDEGDILCKQQVSLKGSLNDIFYRMNNATIILIKKILANKFKVSKQIGTPRLFKRRTPQESEILLSDNLKLVYDKIRSVDGLDYPRAYINHGNTIFKFSNANQKNSIVKASVTITKSKKTSNVLRSLNQNSDLTYQNVVYKKEITDFLYFLNNNRDPKSRISSKLPPSYEDHCEFIKHHPYRFWFIVRSNDSMLGSVYVTFNNYLYVNLLKKSFSLYTKVINNVKNNVEPLPEIKSVRTKNFLINVSIEDNFLQKVLNNMKSDKIQTTYSI